MPEDDGVCPRCEAAKTSWTLVADKTRTLQVSGRKLLVLRGVGAAPVAKAEAEDPPAELVPADHARVLAKDAARELIAADQAPAPRDVLTVRLLPKKHKDLTVRLTVEFETDEEAEHEVPYEGPPLEEGAVHDVRLLFVHGPGDVEGIAFSGLTVIDLTEEDAAEGFAPTVEVAALKKRPKALPVREAGDFFLSARFVDALGGAVAGAAFTVEGVAGQTDDDGRATLPGFAPQDLRVEFADGAVWVPAVHHPDVVVRAPLPFAAQGEPPPAEAAEDPAAQWERLARPAELYPQGEHPADGEDEGPDDDEVDDHHDEESAGELTLELLLTGADGEPLVNEDYVLSFEGGEERGTTSDDGLLLEEIPADLEEATLTIGDEVFELRVGGLDPVGDEAEDGGVRGGQARLHNLGYAPGAVDGDAGEKTRAAVLGFQRDRGLEETGQLDAATRAALEEAHGC